MEITRDMIRIDDDFSVDDDQKIVTAYLETWFDVDKKFGTDVNDDDNAWVNFYADYNVETDNLTCFYLISHPNSCTDHEYKPTVAEAKIIKEMMQETCMKYHGCTLKEYAASMDMTM